MTFLKKLGSIIAKGVQIALGVAPAFEGLMPASTAAIVQQDLTQLSGIITTVEAMGQALSLSGNQKLTAAGPLVAQLIMQSSVMVGKKVADPTLFQKACTEYAQATVDLLNSLHADNAQTQSVPGLS